MNTLGNRRRTGLRILGILLPLLLASPLALAASFYPQPMIRGFSPSSGPPGSVITVTGWGFGGADAAWIGTAHDAPVKFVSAAEIEITVPADAPLGSDRLAVGNLRRFAFARQGFTVTAPAAPKPVVSLSVSPTAITLGGTATLNWSSTNATACMASGAWSGSQPPGGSLAVSPAAAGPYAYALSCSGAGGTGSASASLTVTAPAGFALAVSGNKLVDGAGHAVQLRGANVSGLESTAIQGWDPSDPWGDSGFAGGPQWSTLKSWSINAVRLPLNEASWLGLTTYDQDGSPRQADPGQDYQATVIKAVQDATAAGLYVILDLHWSGPNVMVPGQAKPVPQTPFEANGGQNPMADADHSVAFWTSIANTFKGNPAVAFELYNEPYFYWLTGSETEWSVLLNGGTITQYVTGGDPYQVTYDWQAAGMQQLLDAVRGTGATNVVIAGGVDWCGDMQNWLGNMPADPLHQLAASWHAYPLSGTVGDPNAIVPTGGTAQYGYVQAIAASVPVIITETGDHSAAGTIGSPFNSIVLPWADGHGVSYLGWTWDPWGASDDDLIKDTSGTPTDGFGQYFHDHLICVGNGGANCP